MTDAVAAPRPKLDLSPEWLATLFRAVWRTSIRRQHELGVLNSERALQAHLVSALAGLAPELVTLVEPTLADGAIVPDLWIGSRHNDEALAVVEIKYVPHAYPKWEKDLAHLAAVLDSNHNVAYYPTTGEKERALRCTSTTLGIFAVVGQHDALAVDALALKKGFIASAPQHTAAIPRLLHAWGKVDKGNHDFDVAWLG